MQFLAGACLLSLQGVVLVSALPQVNQEIDTEEDLLAIDSFSNEVSVPVPILPPPPGFAGLGDRFVDGPQQPASQAGGSGDVTALVYNNKLNRDGSYAFNYKTSDGQSRNEQGQVGQNGGYVQTGGWEYIGADGQTYSVTFVADENGFRPVGLHIPSSPALAARRARFLHTSKNNRNNKQVFKRKTETKSTEPRNDKFNTVEIPDNDFSGSDISIHKVAIEDRTFEKVSKNKDSVDEITIEDVAASSSRKNKVLANRLKTPKRRTNPQKGQSKKKQPNRNRGRKSKARTGKKSIKKSQSKGRVSRRGRRVRLKAGEGPKQRRKSAKT